MSSEPSQRGPLGRRRIAQAAVFSAGGYGLRQVIRLGSNMIFARLLFPEAFGLMAIVNAFRTGFEMIADFGIAPSIVQSRRGEDPVFLDTAWTVQIARGVLLFALGVAAAVPVSRVYVAPELAGMLVLASIAFLVRGFSSTSLPRMQRNLSVRAFESVQLAGQLVSAGTILVWLLIEPSVWALVVGGVAGAATRMILSHVLAPRRDHMGWDRSSAREILHFGKWILLSTLVTFVADQADRLLLGRLASLSELGVYSIAAMLAFLPATLIGRMGMAVLFPALSHGLEMKRNLPAVYRRQRKPLLAVGGLLVVLVAAGAVPLIELVYDPRYIDAGGMIQLLIVGTWFRVIEAPARSALMALGETRWLPILNLAKLLSVVIGLPLGFYAAGFPGGIAALVAGDAARWIVATAASARHQLRGLTADVIASAGVLAAALTGVFVANQAAANHGPAFCLLAGSAAAALAFAPMGLWLLYSGGALKRESH